MKATSGKRLSHLCLLAPLAATVAGPLQAVELPVLGPKLPPVDFHGFGSQGFIINSGDNEYLGGESDEGTFDFREYGLSASMAKGKWRLGAQVFGQKLGPYGEDKMTLDWATADYQVAQWLGVRGGRVKMPRGLYNEALDLDSTRPFVFLPQSVYDARLRDFQASFDGGMLYGNLSLGKAGSLDYKVFGGNKPMSTDSGASDYFNIDAPFPNLDIGMDFAVGGSLFWNTPLQGLRIGYSFSRFDDFVTERYVPFRGTATFKNAPAYDRHLASVEYTIGNWVFAAEGGVDDTHYEVAFPPGYNGNPDSVVYARLYPNCYYYYASAAWRPQRWLEVGAYYSYSHWDQTGVGTPVVFPVLRQADYALCARFDITDYLLFKIEGHYLEGAGAVFDVPSNPQPPADRDESWFMFAAKMTFTF